LYLFVSGLLVIAVVAAFTYRRARAVILIDTRPLPRFLRVIAGVFVVLLGLTGIALMLQVDGAFPWDLQPRTSTMFGWIFLGATSLFVFIALKPRWSYLATALAGFLAYDVVLFIPYLQALLEDDSNAASSIYRTTPGAGLTIDDSRLVSYLVVLGISATATIYLLCFYPATRYGRNSQTST